MASASQQALEAELEAEEEEQEHDAELGDELVTSDGSMRLRKVGSFGPSSSPARR